MIDQYDNMIPYNKKIKRDIIFNGLGWGADDKAIIAILGHKNVHQEARNQNLFFMFLALFYIFQ